MKNRMAPMRTRDRVRWCERSRGEPWRDEPRLAGAIGMLPADGKSELRSFEQTRYPLLARFTFVY